jgi:hypothetical protein
VAAAAPRTKDRARVMGNRLSLSIPAARWDEPLTDPESEQFPPIRGFVADAYDRLRRIARMPVIATGLRHRSVRNTLVLAAGRSLDTRRDAGPHEGGTDFLSRPGKRSVSDDLKSL